MSRLTLAQQLSKPFTPRWLIGGCLLFLALYAVLMTSMALSINDGVTATQEPVGQDFVCFYSASQLTLQGRPAEVYGDGFEATQRRLFPNMDSGCLWHYPPMAQIVSAPLSLLPYVPAFITWDVLTLGLFLAVAWWLLPGRLTLLVCLAAPATFWNAWHHQNGFLTAALMAIGLALSGSRPIASGLAIGAFAMKPHLAIVTPVLLAIGRHWRAFLVAGVTSVSFAGLSYAWLGRETWDAFFSVSDRARWVLEENFIIRAIMPSPFAAIRAFELPVVLAYCAQALLAIAALAAAGYAWRRSDDPHLRTAAGLCAAVLITPYLFYYDLTFLTLAGVALVRAGRTIALPAITPGVLALCWLWPLVGTSIAYIYNLQLVWVAPAAVLGLAVWTARSAARP